ncbi:MAG: TonB-dependent receptor [Termitinemataceae bacterium]|nr:MAG: TonB-dependent receptor [Termitinemataceae bacterium]
MSAYNGNSVPLSDIGRIEVLDGSASVQYGNNAVGGVINIITKKSGAAKTFIGISGGSFFSNQEIFSHSAPTKWGHFSINGGHSGTNGYRQHQASSNANASVAGTIDINDTMAIDLGVSFSKIDMQFPGYLSKAQYEDDASQIDNGNFADGGVEYYLTGSAGFTFAPDDSFFIKTPLSYKWRNAESNMSVPSSTSYDNHQNSFEFRPQVSKKLSFGSMNLRILGGIDMYYADLIVTYYDNQKRTGSMSNTIFRPFTLGPYLTLSFNPIKSLSINAGIREDIVIYNIEETKPGSRTEKKDFNSLVYEGSVAFNPIEVLKIYGKYTSLFRYPFTDELFEPVASVYQPITIYNDDLKPEHGFNAEGGIGLYIGKWADIDANFFYMKLEDEIAVVYDSFFYSHNINMDTTQRLGANINVAAHILEYADINASYSFVNATFVDGANEGNDVPLVPQHTFYGSLLGKIPLLGLSFGPDFTYKSEFYRGGDNTNAQDKIDGYFLVGAKARWAMTKDNREYAIQVTLKNLADTKYVSQVYYSGYYPDADMGRSFNISLQCRY